MAVDWQKAVVNDDGIEFAYIDSGEVQGDTYTTVICIHGHSFHARNFSPLLPVAPSHNLRIVALNRRDYKGSTLLSQGELDALNGADPVVHASFLKDRALELAQFLVWFVKEKHIPIAAADGKSGGLAVIGWSLGNVFTLAFLRHFASYSKEVKQALAPYLRTLFIYETAYTGLGYPRPSNAYQPLLDPDIPERAKGIAFGTWASSYYTHPCYDELSDPDPAYRSLSSLQMRTPSPSKAPKPATSETFTLEELLASTDQAPDLRSDRAYWNKISAAVIYENAVGSFILDEETIKDELTPPVKIRMMYGLSSMWSIQWATWELEKDLEKWRDEGKQLRDVALVPVEGANHFLHYEDPELFLATLSEGISS